MCVLRAYGELFDVDEFLKTSDLSPCKVYHKGERRRPRSSRDLSYLDASGLNLVVSDKEFNDLPGQIRDAIDFLQEHEDELQRLGEYTSVENVRLDFAHDGRNVAVQCDYLPVPLLRAAGNLGIGIELSLSRWYDNIDGPSIQSDNADDPGQSPSLD